MKYKVGDKVKVKSLEWYNANCDKHGYIKCQDIIYFTQQMSKYCGKIVTIDYIWEDEFYWIQEDEQHFDWTDDMFEGLVDEDLEFQCAIAKTVKECLWEVNDEIDVYLLRVEFLYKHNDCTPNAGGNTGTKGKQQCYNEISFQHTGTNYYFLSSFIEA